MPRSRMPQKRGGFHLRTGRVRVWFGEKNINRKGPEIVLLDAGQRKRKKKKDVGRGKSEFNRVEEEPGVRGPGVLKDWHSYRAMN